MSVYLQQLPGDKSLKEGQIVQLNSQKYSVEAPVHIQPGQAWTMCWL